MNNYRQLATLTIQNPAAGAADFGIQLLLIASNIQNSNSGRQRCPFLNCGIKQLLISNKTQNSKPGRRCGRILILGIEQIMVAKLEFEIRPLPRPNLEDW